jgi:PncC family amidohydrolase
MDIPAELVALAQRIQAGCLDRGWRVGLAESCTGGLVTATLTAVPGSSGYLRGGLVTYADAAKVDLLGVSPETIARHGAVSAQVARAMALGARERLVADVAIAVTGISGPAGGSAEKPVGLTYVALAGPDGVEVERHQWHGDRAANREAGVRAALQLLLRAVEGPA